MFEQHAAWDLEQVFQNASLVTVGGVAHVGVCQFLVLQSRVQQTLEFLHAQAVGRLLAQFDVPVVDYAQVIDDYFILDEVAAELVEQQVQTHHHDLRNYHLLLVVVEHFHLEQPAQRQLT